MRLIVTVSTVEKNIATLRGFPSLETACAAAWGLAQHAPPHSNVGIWYCTARERTSRDLLTVTGPRYPDTYSQLLAICKRAQEAADANRAAFTRRLAFLATYGAQRQTVQEVIHGDPTLRAMFFANQLDTLRQQLAQTPVPA